MLDFVIGVCLYSMQQLVLLRQLQLQQTLEHRSASGEDTPILFTYLSEHQFSEVFAICEIDLTKHWQRLYDKMRI